MDYARIRIDFALAVASDFFETCARLCDAAAAGLWSFDPWHQA